MSILHHNFFFNCPKFVTFGMRETFFLAGHAFILPDTTISGVAAATLGFFNKYFIINASSSQQKCIIHTEHPLMSK